MTHQLRPEVLRELLLLCDLAIEEAERQTWRGPSQEARRRGLFVSETSAKDCAATLARKIGGELTAGYFEQALEFADFVRELEETRSEPSEGAYHRLYEAIEEAILPLLRQDALDKFMVALDRGDLRWLEEVAFRVWGLRGVDEIADAVCERLSDAIAAGQSDEARCALLGLRVLYRGVAPKEGYS